MRLLWVTFCALVLVMGCDRPAGPASQTGEYRAVATVGMVRDLVANIGGEKVRVETLMGAGVDPHLYKPTRDDVVRLIRADIVFYNGLHLEGKMIDVLEKVHRRKPVHAVAAGLDDAYLLFPSGPQGQPDPHVWMDVASWAHAAEAVRDALVEHDPGNAEYYRANAAAYIAKLKQLDSYGKRIIASIPREGRIVISSHDAFNYFGRAYNIEVMGVQGLSTESEAGLRRLNELVAIITQRGVRAVFVESSVPRKSIEALIAGVEARGGKVAIGGELFTDAMGAEGTYEGTYVGMMDHNLTTVARALGGETPQRGMLGRLSDGRH